VLEARELRDKASEMETVFQAFPDLGFSLDREGTILSYYAGAQGLLYLPSGEFLGRPMQEVLPPEIGERFEDALRSIRRRAKMRRIEYRLRVGERERYWEARLLPLPGQDVFAIVRELTHQKNLEKEILQTARREHMAIGQELHDGVGQEVRGLGYLAKSLAKRLQRREADEAAEAGQLAEGLEGVLKQLRAIAKGLIPVEVNVEGLMVALRELVKTAEERSDCACDFECPHPVPVDDDHVALHMFRIAQEALSNSIRHANADRITIRLEVIDAKLVLEIRDDGEGIGRTSGERQGLGLRTMQYRAALIGASYSAGNAAGGGTVVRCSVDVGKPD
jgi:signal transduction histidine kinase